MRIGELAVRCGVASHVLRHWEEVGVLEPAKRVAGQRRYRPEQVTRVFVIRRAQQAGLSLEQIRAVLDAPPEERRQLLAAHLAAVEERIRELEVAREMVEHAMRCRFDDFTRCLDTERIVLGGRAGLTEPGRLDPLPG